MDNDVLIQVANSHFKRVNRKEPFSGDSEITLHKQYGGIHEGKTLAKIYQSGSPSFLAMVLLGDCPKVITAKQDAKDIKEPKKLKKSPFNWLAGFRSA